MSIFQSEVASGQSSNLPVLTVADLRDKYGFNFTDAKNSYFQNLILAAQNACASYMGMDTLKQLNTCTEYIDVEKSQKQIVLRGLPLKSIEHVYNGESDETTNFLVDYKTNVVMLKDGATKNQVKVNYTIGWDSNVPTDVLYAVAMTVQYMARMANSALVGKNSQNTEGGSETYEQSVVPSAVRVYLDRYRQHKVN